VKVWYGNNDSMKRE